jgi:ATP-dependent Clp protease ATP-binding subunit ClpA
MFELFTDEARDAVMGAQIEARELAHDHVGAEHLLLGLLRLPVERDSRAVALEPAGLGPRVLAELGITADQVRAELQATMQGGGPALTDEDAEALRSIGIDVNEIRRRVEETFGPGALDVPAGARRQSAGAPAEIGQGFTARARKVMETAVIQSIRRGHRHIGSEHLLLAVAASDGPCADILRSLGTAPSTVRARVLELLGRAA